MSERMKLKITPTEYAAEVIGSTKELLAELRSVKEMAADGDEIAEVVVAALPVDQMIKDCEKQLKAKAKRVRKGVKKGGGRK